MAAASPAAASAAASSVVAAASTAGAANPAWKRLLQASLAKQSNQRTVKFVQLATVRQDGRPANRTVVFRGFLKDSCRLMFYTDTRSAKIGETATSPWAEVISSFQQHAVIPIGFCLSSANVVLSSSLYFPWNKVCWYMSDTWEQFRILGTTEIVGAGHTSPLMAQLRERSWNGLSDRQKKTWRGPEPGIPRPVDEAPAAQQTKRASRPTQEDDADRPLDCFCLLLLTPLQVDYLNIKADSRAFHSVESIQSEEGDSSDSEQWVTTEVVP